MFAKSLRSFFALLLVPTAAVVAVACSSTTDSTAGTGVDTCTLASGTDGGPACGETVNACASADRSVCYITVGATRIACTSCDDRASCEAAALQACPAAATCSAPSASGCSNGSLVSTCSNGVDACYFLVGSTRVDCDTCSASDKAACAARVTALCTPDAGADAGDTSASE